MATSFLPNTEDATLKAHVQETVPDSQPDFEMNGPNLDIPLESEMPIENMEGHPTQDEHFLEEVSEVPETNKPTPVAVTRAALPVKPIPSTKDEFALQIEKIMEEDLGDVYLALTPIQKQQFKIKGEETAHKIQQILATTKVKLGKIIKLIFDWLKILPGINRFFLEQEAKIKAEKIITLSEHKKNIN